MKQQIKGTVPFVLTVEGNNVNIEYGDSPENTLAVMAIANLILTNQVDFYAEEKLKIKGGDRGSRNKKTFLTGAYNTFKKGKIGTKKILDILLFNYEGFKKEKIEQDKLRDEKSDEIMKYLKENATIEEGVMSSEEAERLLGDKYKDLKKEEKNPAMKPIKSHLERIQCPECGLKQNATVEHTIVFNIYIHVCNNKKCKHIIMEQEWKTVK